MINVFLDTSPLESGHAHRGIGGYTRNLKKYLAKIKTISLVDDEQSADIVHYPFFDFFSATLPIFKSRPTVVTIHDVIPLEFPNFYPSGLKGALNLTFQKAALLSVARVITDSNASAATIMEHLPINKNKIEIISLAAQKKLSYASLPSQQKIAKKYNLPKSFVLYVGDINYNKNILGLLEAVALSGKELVCVGKNFREQLIPEWDRIITTVAKYNLQDRVHFLNNVASESDLAAIYSQATVYIQPSFSEGFGLPILEAMQCHTPVICFKQSSMQEVGGAHAVYPENSSAESLAKSITSVFEWTGNERRKWVLQAYSWSQTFTWKKTAEQTGAVYERIMLGKK